MRGEKDSEEKRNGERLREKGVSQEGAAGWGNARLRKPEAGEGAAWLPWTVRASPEEGGKVTGRGSDTVGKWREWTGGRGGEWNGGAGSQYK